MFVVLHIYCIYLYICFLFIIMANNITQVVLTAITFTFTQVQRSYSSQLWSKYPISNSTKRRNKILIHDRLVAHIRGKYTFANKERGCKHAEPLKALKQRYVKIGIFKRNVGVL